MGRAKMKMKLIEKPKSRLLTFKKRKEGLMKKLHQLSTLCDVAACMIIVEPSENQTSIWPEQNPDEVRRLIDMYRSKDMGSIKSYGVADFLAEKKKKAEEELQKLRKTNSDAMFPSWNSALDSMSGAQLREVAASLLGKAQIIGSRIQAMRMREAQDLEMMKNNMLLLNSGHQFHNLDHRQEEFKPSSASFNGGMQLPMNMQQQQQQQQNYYAPMPQPYMIWPANMEYYPTTMDQNTNMNYYRVNGDYELFMG